MVQGHRDLREEKSKAQVGRRVDELMKRRRKRRSRGGGRPAIYVQSIDSADKATSKLSSQQPPSRRHASRVRRAKSTSQRRGSRNSRGSKASGGQLAWREGGPTILATKARKT